MNEPVEKVMIDADDDIEGDIDDNDPDEIDQSAAEDALGDLDMAEAAMDDEVEIGKEKSDDRADKTEDDDAEDDTAEEDDTALDETSDDPTEFESEAAFLEAQGITGHESIADYKNAQDAEFQSLAQTLEAGGINTKASNMSELVQDLQARIADAEANPGTGKEDEAQPADLDGVFEKWESKFEKDGQELTDSYKGMMGDIMGAAIKATEGKMADVTSRLSKQTERNDMLLTMNYYNMARANAGKDDHIPSFAEARMAYQKLTPEQRSAAEFGLLRFGNTNNNPMTDIFKQIGAAKLPGGISVKDAKKKDAAALKIKIGKSMISATSKSSTSKKKVVSFDDMSTDDQGAALDDLTLN